MLLEDTGIYWNILELWRKTWVIMECTRMGWNMMEERGRNSKGHKDRERKKRHVHNHDITPSLD